MDRSSPLDSEIRNAIANMQIGFMYLLRTRSHIYLSKISEESKPSEQKCNS